jgi:cephalosporin-C deacetylase-like acetyl esterase
MQTKQKQLQAVSRRRFLHRAGTAALAPLAMRLSGSELTASYNAEFPDMLLTYMSGRLNALAEKWARVKDEIKTPAQIEERNRQVREKFRLMLHGLPDRTPLDAVTVKRFRRDGYEVENVMFQSRPNFWVTGNLYIPAAGAGPFPGIISPCGHYPRARMEPEYQFAYLNLVRSGFVVLSYDPIGEGERREYWNPETGETEVARASTYEHSMPGQVLLLLGENLTQYRIWDGMRAIDYLTTRPEVDPDRIGCAGHSGGGTLTRFISALDERVKCAAVNEGGNGDRWPVTIPPGSPVGPSDVEQNLFPAALYGIDFSDLLMAVAPRPLLVTVESYTAGFDKVVNKLKERYALLGAADKFATAEADDPHSWTVKLRLATTDWLSRNFYGKPGPVQEPDFEPETPRTLYCTPTGSIKYAHRGDTIFSLILKKGADITPSWDVPASPSEIQTFRAKMRGELTRAIRCDTAGQAQGVRHLVTTPRKGYRVEHVEFLSEPGIYIPSWVFVPERRNREDPIVFVHEAGKDVEGQEFGLLERLTRQGNLIVAIDVRGVGDTRPRHAGAGSGPFAHLFDVDTAISYMAWFMDRSLFGMRVHDVIRTLDYAQSRAEIGTGQGLRAIGVGAGALWVLYAAALDDRIHSVTAQNGLLSYQSLTQVDRYLHGAGIFVPDVLARFDLPQVAGAIAGRELWLVSPTDPMKRPVDTELARSVYSWTEQVYHNVGASERFHIKGALEV